MLCGACNITRRQLSLLFDCDQERRSLGVGGLDPWKYIGEVRVCLDPIKCHILSFKLLLGNSASFTSSRTKDLCQKWKAKLIFRGGAYRLSGTGIFECLHITDVGCNLKQFDGLTRLTPIFYDRSRPADCGRTSGCDVVEVIRLGSHHDLVADDGRTVYISALSSASRRVVLAQNLRRRPQLSWSK